MDQVFILCPEIFIFELIGVFGQRGSDPIISRQVMSEIWLILLCAVMLYEAEQFHGAANRQKLTK